MKQKLLNSIRLRIAMLVALLCSLGTGNVWADATVAVDNVLWTEPFKGTNTTTSFSATSSWGDYINPTTFVAADKSDLTYSSSNAMLNSATSTNMDGAHVWLNKSVDGYIQVTGIKLYNATKVKVSWAQATKGSSTTVYYQFDGEGDFTELSTCSGPNAEFKSTELSVSDHTTIALKFAHPKSNDKNTRIDNLTLTVTEIAAASGTTAAPSISGNTPFLSNTTVTIDNAASADGAAIYYTLNGSDPTTTTSATCFSYSEPFTVDETTTVKAIAKHAGDDNASTVTSETFTKVTPMTVSAALTAIDALADNGTIADQCVSGIVCTAGSLSSGAITYYISADGTETNRLQVYKGKGLNNADFEAAGDIAVGDEVVIYGTLKKYKSGSTTTPEFDQGSFLLSKVRKPAPSFSLDIEEATLEAYTHDTKDVTLTTNTDGGISCESTNTDVATVALKSAGVYTITAQSEGSATITIKSAASANYQAAEATVSVTVNDSRTDAGISFAEDEEEITWGDSFTGQSLTNTNSLAVTYSSTDPTVATVNASGVVSVLKAGSTTIKATFAGNATYKAAVASYDLTINKAEAGLSFDETEFDIEKDDASFIAPTLNNPNSLTVTYSSSNEEVTLVDENTGELAYNESAVGTATITATFAGNDNFKNGSASYTINIYDPTVKGTKQNPYTVAEVIAMNPTSTSTAADGQSDIYVTGYIVGEYRNKTAVNTTVLQSDFSTDANIAIADDPTTALDSSIPVNLTKTADKNSFGNKTNSGKTIGYKVLIKGDALKYFGMPGFKNIDEISAVSVPATIGSTGWTTFASAYPLDLSSITASTGTVTAYYASSIVGDSYVRMTSTTSTVAAGEGLMLKGTVGATITIPVAASGEAISGNLLKGCTTSTDLSTSESKYVLVNNGGTAEFQSLAEHGATIPAGKAYLDASIAGVKALRIVFEDTETGIQTIDNGQLTMDSDAVIFNLAGQRVNKAQKGLYILNGRKVLVK